MPKGKQYVTLAFLVKDIPNAKQFLVVQENFFMTSRAGGKQGKSFAYFQLKHKSLTPNKQNSRWKLEE